MARAFSQFNPNGHTTTAVAAGTSADTVIKAEQGILARVLVTATGTNAMTIHDDDEAGSGTIIGCLPANPTVGTTYEFSLPAQTGIVVNGDGDRPRSNHLLGVGKIPSPQNGAIEQQDSQAQLAKAIKKHR